MYTDYYTYPANTKAGYTPYPKGYQCNYTTYDDQDDDRLFGAGLVAPFLLGGLTGAAVAPYFYRPYYYPYPMYPPYPYFRY